MEAHGIVVVLPPEVDAAAATVDAFSSRSARPLVVLTRNRANDVYRHRFTAAHERGHLVLHGDAMGDSRQEREADAFAAEFLTPQASVLPLLPRRMDLGHLAGLRRTWGVSVHSLVYRCRELGLISRRAGRTSACEPWTASPASPRNRSAAIRASSQCCCLRRSIWQSRRRG
ncbi:ImmA/IrrE family metallo-endopeptidase [Streptomyces ardesiacus]|uniref:ImmA/IrrE family metallo-endopeptidase n=1 Tax=Streptomyces ardesiacus TaxID=285564 RepID=UPI00364467B2